MGIAADILQVDVAPAVLLGIVAYAIGIAVLILVFDYFLGWVERKVIAKIQRRHGPTYTGKYGLLQNLADFVKLLAKEHAIPKSADVPVFLLAIPLMLAISLFLIFIIPFSPTLIETNLGLGVLVVFVLLSFMPLIVFAGGFSSGNKFAAISAQRSVVMLLSYEIPLIIVVATVCALAGSYSIAGIVNAQSQLWFALLSPIGFGIFFIAMLAELERPPFDMREADSELIAGWLTDVSAPYYMLALFLDYTRMFLGSLLIVILFLGGWYGPFLPPVVWLLLKVFVVSLFIMILRATNMRMKIDSLLRLGWFGLLPFSLLNLIITYLIFIG
jgi:NADH-quinone oxidoreductase subunit H